MTDGKITMHWGFTLLGIVALVALTLGAKYLWDQEQLKKADQEGNGNGNGEEVATNGDGSSTMAAA